MKKIYAKYGDTIYELREPASNKNDIAKHTSRETRVVISEPGSVAKVFVDLGILNEDLKTNAQVVKEAVMELSDKKVSKIDSLIPSFEIALNYTLINAKNNNVIDEGVIIKHNNDMHKQNKFRILGIDEDNNTHYRFVKSLETEFELKYRESSPCGIMGNKNDEFVFIINSIVIHHVKHDPDKVYSSNDETEIEHGCCEGVAYTRESYAHQYRKPLDVVVFDSVSEGVQFRPITINSKFRKLIVDVDMILNNYFIVYDDETITDILDINGSEEDPEVPIEDDEGIIYLCDDSEIID